MSDDLPARIAAWLSAKRPCRNTTFGCSPDKPCPTCRMDADALIRELGLQAHLAKRIINGKPDQWVRRHVTDWEIVDD